MDRKKSQDSNIVWVGIWVFFSKHVYYMFSILLDHHMLPSIIMPLSAFIHLFHKNLDSGLVFNSPDQISHSYMIKFL